MATLDPARILAGRARWIGPCCGLALNGGPCRLPAGHLPQDVHDASASAGPPWRRLVFESVAAGS